MSNNIDMCIKHSITPWQLKRLVELHNSFKPTVAKGAEAIRKLLESKK